MSTFTVQGDPWVPKTRTHRLVPSESPRPAQFWCWAIVVLMLGNCSFDAGQLQFWCWANGDYTLMHSGLHLDVFALTSWCICACPYVHVRFWGHLQQSWTASAVILVILVICQNRKLIVKIRHYNINILFIYSELWPRFRNRFWPKWLWPNDH